MEKFMKSLSWIAFFAILLSVFFSVTAKAQSSTEKPLYIVESHLDDEVIINVHFDYDSAVVEMDVLIAWGFSSEIVILPLTNVAFIAVDVTWDYDQINDREFVSSIRYYYPDDKGLKASQEAFSIDRYIPINFNNEQMHSYIMSL